MPIITVNDANENVWSVWIRCMNMKCYSSKWGPGYYESILVGMVLNAAIFKFKLQWEGKCFFTMYERVMTVHKVSGEYSCTIVCSGIP